MKPLTIEELKALQVGDWVWIESLCEWDDYYNRGRYVEIDCIDEDNLCFVADCKDWEYRDYGKTWIAYKNKEQAEMKADLYRTAFELILQDVYETRLQADVLSCSSCPFMEEIFDECQNQGLYEDCKERWQKYYLSEAEARLKELRGKNKEGLGSTQRE